MYDFEQFFSTRQKIFILLFFTQLQILHTEQVYFVLFQIERDMFFSYCIVFIYTAKQYSFQSVIDTKYKPSFLV